MLANRSGKECLGNLQMKNLYFDNNDLKDELVGSSEKMSDVFDRINKLSYTNTAVIIQGENGTGKELVARKIHQSSSHKHGEFIAINCAAVSSHLLETELFGHEKGTFIDATEKKMGLLQMANRGILFLNEVSALSLNLQEKLLYVLENRNFFLLVDVEKSNPMPA